MSLIGEKLSHIWFSIQETLFPLLERDLGELNEKQRQLVSILEVVRIESLIISSRGWPGRPEKGRREIARAFVAKVVYNITTTRQLIERLQSDPTLRRLCGRERRKDLPSEATFSRAFAEFSRSKLGWRVNRAWRLARTAAGNDQNVNDALISVESL